MLVNTYAIWLDGVGFLSNDIDEYTLRKDDIKLFNGNDVMITFNKLLKEGKLTLNHKPVMLHFI